MPPFPLPPGQVVVFVMDPATVGAERVEDSLSLAEKQQAGRFRFEKDAVHWGACRTALREILADALAIAPAGVALEFGEFGKPLLAPPLEGLHFNLSHCRDLALIALCGDGPVGIDVEPADRATSLLGCESAFCHPEEIAALPEDDALKASSLLGYWTAKESLLKALGTGMSLPPQSVSVAAPPQSFAADPRFSGFRLHRLSAPVLGRHVACLAAPVSSREIVIREWPAARPGIDSPAGSWQTRGPDDHDG